MFVVRLENPEPTIGVESGRVATVPDDELSTGATVVEAAPFRPHEDVRIEVLGRRDVAIFRLDLCLAVSRRGFQEEFLPLDALFDAASHIEEEIIGVLILLAAALGLSHTRSLFYKGQCQFLISMALKKPSNFDINWSLSGP